MRSEKRRTGSLATGVAIVGALLALPVSAWADGIGLPPAGAPEQWAQLEEGQQIAVVTLERANTAHIDLFVSMLDRTGEAREVVFLLPLGMDSSDFEVTERTSLQFDETVTEQLDRILLHDAEQTASFRRGMDYALLSGTLFINGAWTWPFWILWSLTACAPGGEVVPLATYETESSKVAIYGVDREASLEAFLEATGLNPAVKDTLARLRGQQIAVVRLQTQPRPLETSGRRGEPSGQPGIHLSWTAALVAQSGATASRQLSGGAASGLLSGGTTYAYPLGTGSAWAHPIEWTRVYVVSPPGIDFAVEYPELGPDQSGYVVPFLGATKPRIQNARGPAHAVENAVGDFGRVWRATYMHSNSSEDVIITLLPEMSAETLGALRRLEQRAVLQAGAYVVSILVAVLLWLVVWRYTMPRLLDISYTWREFRLYCHALGWALLYPLTNSVLFGLALVLGPLTAGVSILLGAPLLFVTLLGILSLALFTYWSSQTLKTSPGRAVRAYIVVALASNALYVVYVLSCRTLLGLG